MTDQQKIDRMIAALLGIAMMDVYTRPTEKDPHEVMRELALTALREVGEMKAASFAEEQEAINRGG